MRLLLLFIVVPLLELYLLLWVGSVVGFWPTLALTVLSGMLGSVLARREGLRVWRAWRGALERLEPPSEGVIEGILVLVGGALLITPGILSDITGLALLVPWTRRRVAARVRRAVERRIAQGRMQVITVPYPTGVESGDEIIETTGEDVEFEESRRNRS